MIILLIDFGLVFYFGCSDQTGIGKDIGLVISKGVFLSVVCVFTVMPSLILWFDDMVDRLDKNNLKASIQERLAQNRGGDVNV